MSHQIITVRLPLEQVESLDQLAEEKHVTRSAMIKRILEEFINEIDERGYLIPPYEGDEILNDVRFGCRRQDARKMRKPVSPFPDR